MQIFEALSLACDELIHNAVINPRVDAEILLACSLGRSRSYLLAHFQDTVDEPFFSDFFCKVRERCKGKPLQYILGYQEFLGLEFEVSPAVFIPRPETEFVVETALKYLEGNRLTIVDVGTGSGCLAVTLAKTLPQARVWAIDLSEAALKIARRNADRHGVTRRIGFLQGDLLEPLKSLVSEGQIDAIVSNPPYVSQEELLTLQKEVRDWEPHLALVGQDPGSSIYPHLVSQSMMWLKPGGILVMEIGYRMQEEVCALFRQGWKQLKISEDLSGIPRAVAGVKV